MAKERIDKLEGEIDRLNNTITTHQKVTLTAYHPSSRGINSDKDHNKTATMNKPKSGWTVAISTELVHMGWLGKRIYIDGYGIRKATDRMRVDVKGNHIDLCFPNLKEAKKFGKKKNILAVLLH